MAAWVESLDDRETAILRGRLVRSPARTLDDIGQEFEVTRERIRQLEVKLLDKIPGLLERADWRMVRWEVFAVRQRLGSFAPLAELEAAELSSADGFPRALLLWLAGYDRTDDHVIRRRFQLPGLSELPLVDDLPVIDEDATYALFRAEGIAEPLLAWALDSVKGVGRVDGVPVLWPGNIVDKSYAVLAVRNAPMTPLELFDAIGGGVNLNGLRGRLYEDDRMCRVTRSTIGLKAWGGEEYTSIVGLMVAELEKHGEMALTDLADNLNARFDAAAGSVKAYAGAPVFVIDGDNVRLRTPEEPYVPRDKPHKIGGLFRSGADSLVWNLVADRDLMRGSGRSIPPEIATFLGVRPGARVQLANEARDVPLTWLESNHMGPNLGSLKVVAEAAGVVEGEYLRVEFGRTKHTIAVTKRPPAPAGETPAEVIAWHSGLPVFRCDSQEEVAWAAHSEVTSAGEVLAARGDSEIADRLAELPLTD